MLLSESELRAALEPLLDRLLIERLRLFQLQLEPRIQLLLEQALTGRGVNSLTGDLGRLLGAAGLPQVLAAVFEQSAALVGPVRALVITWDGQAMVWRSSGIELPSRFPASQLEATLRPPARGQGGSKPIQVRGRQVAVLSWRGELAPEAEARLDLLLRLAGLALLQLGLPGPHAALRPEATAAAAPAAPTAARPVPEGAAARFAALLIEDLTLYLQRERAAELGEALRAGDVPRRFAPEVERCRAAFTRRYPTDSGATPDIFDAATAHLGRS